MQRQKRIVEDFFTLVKIDSPSKNEAAMAEHIKHALQELGCKDISEDTAGDMVGSNAHNIYGYFPGTVSNAHDYPTIMFCAHMDCVNPCIGIEPQLVDGVITSKGNTILGSDDKSGILAILEGLRRLKEDAIAHGNIQVIFTVVEEDSISGAKYVDKSKIKADFGYVLDCTGAPGTIINAAPGINSFDITITGKSAHAGIAPELGINAITIAGKALAACPQGRIDAVTTCNVGLISGGTAVNIVADHVNLTCEARSLNTDAFIKISQDIVNAFTQAAKEGGADINIVTTTSCEAYNFDHNAPIITLVQQACENLGFAVEILSSGGGSDANVFNTFGIPSIPLGTGMSKVHTTHEFITLEHLENICQLVVGICQQAVK